MNCRGGLCVTKLYLDCIGADGSCGIAYRARLRCGPVALGYAAVLRHEPGGAITYLSTAHPGPAPTIHSRRLAWRTPQLDLAVEACAQTPPFSHRLLDGPAGTIDWECLAPAAHVCFRQGDLPPLQGLGYAERLQLELPRLQLPIEELRWGRFVAPDRAIVWIRWGGSEPRTLVFDKGQLQPGATIGDHEIRFGHSRLVLGTGAILRDAHLSEAAPFAILGPLDRLGRVHEVKWLSPAALHDADDGEPVNAWVIHERVAFP